MIRGVPRRAGREAGGLIQTFHSEFLFQKESRTKQICGLAPHETIARYSRVVLAAMIKFRECKIVSKGKKCVYIIKRRVWRMIWKSCGTQGKGGIAYGISMAKIEKGPLDGPFFYDGRIWIYS